MTEQYILRVSCLSFSIFLSLSHPSSISLSPHHSLYRRLGPLFALRAEGAVPKAVVAQGHMQRQTPREVEGRGEGAPIDFL